MTSKYDGWHFLSNGDCQSPGEQTCLRRGLSLEYTADSRKGFQLSPFAVAERPGPPTPTPLQQGRGIISSTWYSEHSSCSLPLLTKFLLPKTTIQSLLGMMLSTMAIKRHECSLHLQMRKQTQRGDMTCPRSHSLW